MPETTNRFDRTYTSRGGRVQYVTVRTASGYVVLRRVAAAPDETDRVRLFRYQEFSSHDLCRNAAAREARALAELEG